MLEIKFKKETVSKPMRVTVESEETKIVMDNQYNFYITLYNGRAAHINGDGRLDLFDKNGDPVDNW